MSQTTSTAPDVPPPGSELETVPIRHYGRWAMAVVVGILAVSLVVSLVRNPNLAIDTVFEYLFKPYVLKGVGITIMLTVVAMILGTLGAIVVAIMRLSENPVFRAVSWVYVWFFRGTPLLVQIIFWGFMGALYQEILIGVPLTDITFASFETSSLIGPTTAAVLALTFNEVAYAAEIVRAGIVAVDEGQTEAAEALGMTRGQTLRRVVLPQAMRVIVPPMGNETITMLKSTALVAVIGGRDLLTAVQNVYAQNFQVIPLLVVATIWYLVLTSILSVGQAAIERRYGRGFGSSADSPGAMQRWFSGVKVGRR